MRTGRGQEAHSRLPSAQDAIVVWGSWRKHRLRSYGEELDRSGSSCKALAATTDVTCAEQAKRSSYIAWLTDGRIDVMMTDALTSLSTEY